MESHGVGIRQSAAEPGTGRSNNTVDVLRRVAATAAVHIYEMEYLDGRALRLQRVHRRGAGEPARADPRRASTRSRRGRTPSIPTTTRAYVAFNEAPADRAGRWSSSTGWSASTASRAGCGIGRGRGSPDGRHAGRGHRHRRHRPARGGGGAGRGAAKAGAPGLSRRAHRPAEPAQVLGAARARRWRRPAASTARRPRCCSSTWTTSSWSTTASAMPSATSCSRAGRPAAAGRAAGRHGRPARRRRVSGAGHDAGRERPRIVRSVAEETAGTDPRRSCRDPVEAGRRRGVRVGQRRHRPVPDRCRDGEGLLKHADIEMYRAKQVGRESQRARRCADSDEATDRLCRRRPPARRGRPRRAGAELPADRRARFRRDHGRRGADPLERPRARTGAAGRFHPDRGAHRRDRRDLRLGRRDRRASRSAPGARPGSTCSSRSTCRRSCGGPRRCGA